MREVEHDPDRLRVPMRRCGGPGEFEAVGWDEAIADIADRFARTIVTHGPTSVGVYGGNPRTFSFGHGSAVSAFVRAGTPHFYGPIAQDAGARFAATALYGSPAFLPSPTSLARPISS